MPVANQSEYCKLWRARHRHYHRDWMRRRRGGLHPPGRKQGRIMILGVFVNPFWLSKP